MKTTIYKLESKSYIPLDAVEEKKLMMSW